MLEKYDRNKPLDLNRLTDESYAVVAELFGVRPEIETQDADEEKTAIEEKILPRLKKPKIDYKLIKDPHPLWDNRDVEVIVSEGEREVWREYEDFCEEVNRPLPPFFLYYGYVI